MWSPPLSSERWTSSSRTTTSLSGTTRSTAPKPRSSCTTRRSPGLRPGPAAERGPRPMSTTYRVVFEAEARPREAAISLDHVPSIQIDARNVDVAARLALAKHIDTRAIPPPAGTSFTLVVITPLYPRPTTLGSRTTTSTTTRRCTTSTSRTGPPLTPFTDGRRPERPRFPPLQADDGPHAGLLQRAPRQHNHAIRGQCRGREQFTSDNAADRLPGEDAHDPIPGDGDRRTLLRLRDGRSRNQPRRPLRPHPRHRRRRDLHTAAAAPQPASGPRSTPVATPATSASGRTPSHER